MTILGRFCIFLCVFVSGCSANTRMVALPAQEAAVTRDLFREAAARQKKCSPWVDAEVNVSIDSLFSVGTFDGYLQAMTPAYFKLVGTNPFGQPMMAFTYDGKDFQYLSFVDRQYYEGEITAEAVSRYTPPGFTPEDSFYWIIGRIAPGTLAIVDVGGDTMKKGYWVELTDRERKRRSRILFDPERKTILDHALLDSSGDIVVQAAYSEHGTGNCGLPGHVVITGDDYPGSITLRLSDWREDTPFTPDDFRLAVPPGFKRVAVK